MQSMKAIVNDTPALRYLFRVMKRKVNKKKKRKKLRKKCETL